MHKGEEKSRWKKPSFRPGQGTHITVLLEEPSSGCEDQEEGGVIRATFDTVTLSVPVLWMSKHRKAVGT